MWLSNGDRVLEARFLGNEKRATVSSCLVCAARRTFVLTCTVTGVSSQQRVTLEVSLPKRLLLIKVGAQLHVTFYY